MEKRAFERIPAFLNAKLFYDDSFYDALILNLSQNGIYFSAEEYLLSGLNIEISMPLESTELKVPFKVVRISETNTIYYRLGAELLSPSQEYIKFIHGRIASM
jgi:hypothetical protein